MHYLTCKAGSCARRHNLSDESRDTLMGKQIALLISRRRLNQTQVILRNWHIITNIKFGGVTWNDDGGSQ